MIKKLIALTVLTSVIVSGCSVTRQNATTGEEEINSTSKGLVVGCITGVALGALIAKGKGAALGCLAAGGAGAAVGYKLDQQEKILREKLLNSGVQVNRIGDKINLIMPGDVVFDSGMTLLQENIKPVLDSVADVMKEYDKSSLIISGHTDSIGSYDENEKLSMIRAVSVEIYLRNQGVSKNRLYTYGLGETQPICTNMYKDGRACNRRVELDLVFN